MEQIRHPALAACLAIALCPHSPAGDPPAREPPPAPTPATGHVELRSSGLRAVVCDNQAFPPVHRSGYGGLAALHLNDSPDLFVPEYAGLNFEHIFSGDSATYGWNIFEPRRAPLTLRRVSERKAELSQERTEHWPLRTAITYELAGDDAIDFTVRCVPLEDAWRKHGYVGIFFASYIAAPEDRGINFIGRSRPGKGEGAPRWIHHLPAKHGDAAHHRPAGSDSSAPLDPGIPIPLVAGLSDLEFLHPFYYGLSGANVLVLMFERPRDGGEVRFSQSPDGGGDKNPAWDFLYLKRGYQVGKEFGFRGRAVYRKFRGREDVVRAYEAWSGETVEWPAGATDR